MDALVEHTEQTTVTQPPLAPSFTGQPYRTPSNRSQRLKEIRIMAAWTGRTDYLTDLDHRDGWDTTEIHLTLWQQTKGRPARTQPG